MNCETNSASYFCIKNLNVSYGKQHILNNINFTINKGILTGLIGCNGSGKTTLLKTVCNEIPHSGSCTLNNIILEDLSIKEISQKISYIPQRTGIHISMSVLDVVLMGYNPQLKMFENPNKTMIDNAKCALKTVGIDNLLDNDYLLLSEGEKQLCILARTLVEQTSLLLLDEPDSALDFHNKYHMMKLLKQLIIQNNKTALLCLHDPVLALAFCDQLILLKDGTVSDILFPQSDDIKYMETAFSKIYGSVSLHEIKTDKKKSQLILLSDL